MNHSRLSFFAADKAPARLTRLREKLNYLAESGVDYVLCVRFDRRFAALTAQDFISELLVRQLGVQFLAVGDDFRFGAGRQGISLLLQKAGVEFGFDVTSTQTFRRRRAHQQHGGTSGAGGRRSAPRGDAAGASVYYLRSRRARR